MRAVIALLLLTTGNIYADEVLVTGHELMTKMLNVADQINYRGTFVFMHDGQLESMKILHGVSAGGVKERLTALSGEPREVLRDQETVTCVWPNKKLVTVEPASSDHGIPTIIPKELESIENNYRVKVGPAKRIAGQNCRLVAIRPIDYFRYGYELCIQPQTGMLLRSKMFHPRGGLLEEVMFTRLQYLEHINEQEFEPVNNVEGYTWRKPNDDAQYSEYSGELDNSWRVSKLPPGFSVSKISRRLMSTSDEPVQHMVVSDGFAAVSVFIVKPRELNRVHEGRSRHGAINAFSRGFNDHQITVLGEVPNATVEMIGTSIMYDGNLDQ